MNARYWTAWERYLPNAAAGTRKGTAGLCLKPWDQILPEEGIEERMSMAEPLWRTWETRPGAEAVGAIAASRAGLIKVRV
ncbi:MAG TPA: hypothetical protein PKK11_07865 [Methanothrix sp.]|nr:hypothetical protein [Methanothrix sp.]